jgi:hypothetical protein
MSRGNGHHSTGSVAEIFSRLWDVRRPALSPALADHVLRIKFPLADRKRMKTLAEKNRCGKISESELEELNSFVEVGDLLAVMQSKARQVLKKVPK